MYINLQNENDAIMHFYVSNTSNDISSPTIIPELAGNDCTHDMQRPTMHHE
jgi:hypothetical protein